MKYLFLMFFTWAPRLRSHPSIAISPYVAPAGGRKRDTRGTRGPVPGGNRRRVRRLKCGFSAAECNRTGTVRRRRLTLATSVMVLPEPARLSSIINDMVSRPCTSSLLGCHKEGGLSRLGSQTQSQPEPTRATEPIVRAQTKSKGGRFRSTTGACTRQLQAPSSKLQAPKLF